MKVRKQNVMKWVKALRSGKYQQTTGTLQDRIGFCCLGVACKIFIPTIKQNVDQHNFLRGGLPDHQRAPGWLRQVNDDFMILAGNTLSNLNDSGEFSFDEIADLVEAVYIHEVLK